MPNDTQKVVPLPPGRKRTAFTELDACDVAWWWVIDEDGNGYEWQSEVYENQDDVPRELEQARQAYLDQQADELAKVRGQRDALYWLLRDVLGLGGPHSPQDKDSVDAWDHLTNRIEEALSAIDSEGGE